MIANLPDPIISNLLQRSISDLAELDGLPLLTRIVPEGARIDAGTVRVERTDEVALTGAQESAIQSVIDGHLSLGVLADKSIMDADLVDEATITVAGLTTFNYEVVKDGSVIDLGTVSDGSLEFSTDEEGEYSFFIFEGNNTGRVTVNAQESL